jgi:LytS/YehU family sensor histidine kinase
MLWFYVSKDPFTWSRLMRFNVLCGFAIVLFTLVYEILFLSKERELDTKIVKQLDRERSQAEMEALRNELDPHFIFNSLNTLNHLILNDAQKAYAFNNKLAQVYKYFLMNKHRELISLSEELTFIDNYFFLLRIRHDDNLSLLNEVAGLDERILMIPPLALQTLVENAIKHNEFSEAKPLEIRLSVNHQFVKVSNRLKPKQFRVTSTGIGLKNLSARYKLLGQRDIVIETTENEFTVKLPLIKQQDI